MEDYLVSDGSYERKGAVPVPDSFFLLGLDTSDAVIGFPAAVSGIEPDGGGDSGAEVFVEPHVVVADNGIEAGKGHQVIECPDGHGTAVTEIAQGIEIVFIGIEVCVGEN